MRRFFSSQHSSFKHFRTTLGALLTGVLLTLSFPPNALGTFVALFAFVPLLACAEAYREKFFTFFLCALLAMFVWNIGSIWWIMYSTVWGGIFTMVANSLLMCVPILLAFMVYRRARILGLLAWIILWLSFEYFHFHWEVHFPWLTLGNALATTPEWAQWYAYTGVAGGTLWILLCNVLIYILVWEYTTKSVWKKKQTIIFLTLFAVLVFPLLISFSMRDRYEKKLATLPVPKENAIVVQPNIECYEEKFTLPESTQLATLIRLAETQIDSHTRVVAFPETALLNNWWETQVPDQNWISQESMRTKNTLRTWLRAHGKMALITGLNTDRYVRDMAQEYDVAAVRTFVQGSSTLRDTVHYISYNSVAFLDSAGWHDTYHKSKLVPGVERIPYARYLAFMNHFMVDLGGITGSLGTDSIARNFEMHAQKDPIKNVCAAPLICYESIYGDYVRSFAKRGAQVLFIVTNDGWWRDTKGYQQHAAYGLLRAIENRRFIFRSANTGISYIVTPTARIVSSLAWDTQGALKYPLYLLNEKTFYTQHGDYIYQIASVLSVLLILFLLVLRVRYNLLHKKWRTR